MDEINNKMISSPEMGVSDALDVERLSSLIKMVTRLQAEGQHVLESKLALMELKSPLTVSDSSATTELSEEEIQQQIESKREHLQKMFGYLKKN